MIDLHGIVYAYHTNGMLGEFVVHRTSASLPFCSRYRLIDFALSSMTEAGIRDVGVVMQRNYQSLIDHLEGGRDWDLSRGSGGLTLLPPYGMHDSDFGEYRGCMEALSAMRSYVRSIKQNNIVLFRGDLAANIDLAAVYKAHIAADAEITAVCGDAAYGTGRDGIRFLSNEPGIARSMQFRHSGSRDGLPAVEVYIIRKSLLIDFIDWSHSSGKLHFHRDALARYLRKGGWVNLYTHKGYTARISSVIEYYNANLGMLNPEMRADLFPESRPVYTKTRSSVSTYYGETSKVSNSLVADGCYIEGQLTNCVVFRGVKVKKGAKLKNCVILQDCVIGENADLSYVMSDKDAIFADGLVLTGSSVLPICVPKGKEL